jgi:hypothetical protein
MLLAFELIPVSFRGRAMGEALSAR